MRLSRSYCCILNLTAVAGAADLVADAKKHLSIVPTEYDDDGPMPPIQEALLGISDAKLVSFLSLSLMHRARPCMQH